jgi:hypothetical protein
MNSDEMKRSAKGLTKEMKDLTRMAEARLRAIDQSMKELQARGVAGVPRLLKLHGEHFSPAERELLENATEEQILKLIETYKMLKQLRSPLRMACI